MEIDMIKKRARFDQKGTFYLLGFTQPEKPILEASHEVSYTIGKARPPLSTGKTLITQATLKITEIILGKEAMKKIKQVPLSNDVVTS